MCVYRETGVYIDKFEPGAFKKIFANSISDDVEFIISDEWSQTVDKNTDRCVLKSTSFGAEICFLLQSTRRSSGAASEQGELLAQLLQLDRWLHLL